MTLTNSYITLLEFKAFITAPGVTLSNNPADDRVLEQIIEGASRFIDDETSRTFYPRVETRKFNVPEDNCLPLDDDLLEVFSITNGDATAVSTTDYDLVPLNIEPKFEIRLRDNSNVFWQVNSQSESFGVIQVAGIWGWHNRYTQRGWYAQTTLAGNEDASTDIWDVADSRSITADMIVRCGNELGIVESSYSDTDGYHLTLVQRGENGSTAATHDSGATVYVWKPQADVRQAAMEIAKNARDRRWGPNESGTSSLTPGGVVISPADITKTAYQTISRYRRKW